MSNINCDYSKTEETFQMQYLIYQQIWLDDFLCKLHVLLVKITDIQSLLLLQLNWILYYFFLA